MKRFNSLREFTEHLKRLQAIEPKEKELALAAIGQYVKEKAQGKFGIYQNAVGGFAEWAPLADSTMRQRESRGYEPNNPLYVTGELMRSIDDEVTINPVVSKVVVGSDNPIMEWQEFGTHTIPPRPVLGPAMLESVDEIKRILRLMMMGWLTGERVSYTMKP